MKSFLFVLASVGSLAWGQGVLTRELGMRQASLPTTPVYVEVYFPNYRLAETVRFQNSKWESEETNWNGLGFSLGYARYPVQAFGFGMAVATEQIRSSQEMDRFKNVARLTADLGFAFDSDWTLTAGPNMARFTDGGASDALVGYQVGLQVRLLPRVTAQLRRVEMNESNRENYDRRIERNLTGYEVGVSGSF